MKWQSVPFFELREKAPCCPGEWMAAAGRAVAWPKTPGPGRQDGYARNSSHQGDLEKNEENGLRHNYHYNHYYYNLAVIPIERIITIS